MAVNWALGLAPERNPLEELQYYGAMQDRQLAQQGREAFANYAKNPDAQGLIGLAQYNPEFVISERQNQAKMAQAQGKASDDFIANLARNAATPEAWAAGVQIAKQRGINVPPEFEQFTPQNRAALMALGGENQPAPTALERNVEYLNQFEKGLGDRYARNYSDPALPVTEFDANGQGFTSYRPRSSLPGSNGAPAGRPAVGAVVRDPRAQGGAAPGGPRTFR